MITVTNRRLPRKAGEFLVGCGARSFLKRALLQGVRFHYDV